MPGMGQRKSREVMMQSERELPFFKPLNTSQFQQPGGTRVVRHGSNSRTNEQQNKQQESVGGERMSSLHAKLHLEADKIRKWKNQTEFDIKQKDQKITEASHTIENLRKSLLDLQLQNENLSLKLQEEISNREEILRSVASTRQLCSVLKNHCVKTDSKLQTCESEKIQLQYQEKDHQKQFEELSLKFTNLELAHKESHSRLTDELTVVCTERDRIKTEFKSQREQAEGKLKALMAKCDEKDIEIRNIHAEVERNNEKIHVFQTNIDKLEAQLKESKQEHSKTQEKHKGLTKDFKDVQESKASVEVKLQEKLEELDGANKTISELQTQLEGSREDHSKEIFNLQKTIEEQKLEVAQNRNRLRFMEIDLQSANTMLEEVKSSKDMLLIEKTELENRVRELEKQNAELLAQHDENCLVLNQMTASVNDLQFQLANSQQEYTNLMAQINDLRSHMTSVESEKLEMQEKIKVFDCDITSKKASMDELQREFKDRCEQIACLTAQLCQADENLKHEINKHEATVSELKFSLEQNTELMKDIANREKEKKKLQKEAEALAKKNSSISKNLEESIHQQDKLREEIDELKCEIQQLQELNESLQEEKQTNNEELQGKLAKAAGELETKSKTMKSDITAKNKQIKDLEKEIKSLKTKVTQNNKAIDGKDEELKRLHNHLEEQTSEKHNLEQKFLELSDVVEQEKRKATDALKQADEMCKLSEKSVKEKEAMHKQCEMDRNQMCSIMESYKIDGDKFIEERDKEIATLKQKLKEEKENKKQSDKQSAQLQKEIEQLRKTLSDSGYQMESLQKNFNVKENMVSELEKENAKKEEELKELQQQLEKMYIKKTTTSVAQTSPYPDKQYQTPSSRIPTPTPKVVPQTPKADVCPLSDITNTPSFLRTPSNLKTPIVAKTPQGILKSVPTSSASKKRRVIFAPKDEEKKKLVNDSDSDSPEFTVDVGDIGSKTPLILKPSRRPSSRPSPGCQKMEKLSQSDEPALPMNRQARGPPVDLSKNKQVPKEKSSAVRKAPNKTTGKFFKSSPKNKLSKLKEQGENTTWMETDDIFGFASLED